MQRVRRLIRQTLEQPRIYLLRYKVNQWSAGLGLNYKSKYYTGSGSSRIEQDAYVLASAMLGYQVDKILNFNLTSIIFLMRNIMKVLVKTQ